MDYGTFPHLFILKIWFFQFINGITFRWYYVLFCVVDIMVWFVILNKLRIYRVLPDLFYIIFQTRISSWYWDLTVSRKVIIIWDKWWRWISGTNILWYLIHPFLMLLLFIYIPLKCLFTFSGNSFRFIQPSFIQRRGRIYQFSIFS